MCGYSKYFLQVMENYFSIGSTKMTLYYDHDGVSFLFNPESAQLSPIDP